MQLRHIITMIALGAMWGASFLFMKIAVPAMGPVAMMEARVAIAAITLTVVAWLTGKALPRGKQWLPSVMIGVFYTAIPLLLWAYAARSLSASMLSIINATAPLFGAVVSVIWLRETITTRGAFGLMLGFAGVTLLVSGGGLDSTPIVSPAILAAFGASLLYGIMSNYSETTKDTVNPYSNVLGSLWIATVVIAPALLWFPVNHAPSATAWGAVLAMGVLSTALAYILYFQLIDEVGPASALTVTYLIPVFGTLWGALFLGERITGHMIGGAIMIVAGIALVAQARRAQNRRLPPSEP